MLDDFGNLTLIDPDPKEYKELAKSKVCRSTWRTRRCPTAGSTCATTRS